MVQTAKRRLRGTAICVLLFAGVSTCAQTSPPLRVKVEEPGDGTHHYLLPPINLDVIKAFADRAASSDRFKVTKEPADLVVYIVCLDTSKNDKFMEGDFCTYTFVYRSRKAPEFNMPLGTPSPILGFRASEIAEDIFQAFLTETTETKLSVAELEVAFRVAEFCSKPGNQVPCSGKYQ